MSNMILFSLNQWRLEQVSLPIVFASSLAKTNFKMIPRLVPHAEQNELYLSVHLVYLFSFEFFSVLTFPFDINFNT